jgi:hypothetical protein
MEALPAAPASSGRSHRRKRDAVLGAVFDLADVFVMAAAVRLPAQADADTNAATPA